MICSPLLAKQYFPRHQKFLGTPLQVNQQAYAKQAKKCRSVIKILVMSSACLQFLGFRSHDGGHFATMHTVPFLLLFSFWLGHATSFPRRFFMTLEVAPPPKPRKSALGTRLWGMQMLQFIPAWLGFVQTDATTPNIGALTMLAVVACVLAVVCKRMQQLPTMLGPAVHRGKDTTHKSL